MIKVYLANQLDNLLNYQVLALIGITFQIYGGLFLGLEAIGLNKIVRFISAFQKFSKWFKKSLMRMALIIIPFFLIMTVAIIFDLKIMVGLFFPSIIFLFGASLLIDHPDFFEKRVINESKDKRIGPFGFVVLTCGCILQMISIIWQMSLH